MAGLAIAAAPPASAGPAWTNTTSPTPPTATSFSFNGVACPTPGSCFAVGKQTTPTGIKSLVQHWNGSGWGVLVSPNPASATSTTLSGVACPGPKNCFAVGNFNSPTGPQTLAMHWNGSSWSLQPTPNPSSALGSGLNAVACPTTQSCFAVGNFQTSTSIRTLAMHWNGSLWGLQPVISPQPSNSGTLNGIACPIAKSCFTVGSYTSAGVAKTLVEHWNGSAWGLQSSPNVSGSTTGGLAAVSCPSPKNCFAVGNYSIGSAHKNLVQHWNGSLWGVMKSFHPAGSTATNLTGVSCPNVKSCFAIGNFAHGAVVNNMVEHWNGTQWGIMTTPNPGTFFDHLFSISCATRTQCFSVGDFATFPPGKGFALRYA